jgi:hypothetical protein
LSTACAGCDDPDEVVRGLTQVEEQVTATCLLVRSPACYARQLQTSIVPVVRLRPTEFREGPWERLERHKPKGLRVVLRGLGSSNSPRLPGPEGSNPLGRPGPELQPPIPPGDKTPFVSEISKGLFLMLVPDYVLLGMSVCSCRAERPRPQWPRCATRASCHCAVHRLGFLCAVASPTGACPRSGRNRPNCFL